MFNLLILIYFQQFINNKGMSENISSPCKNVSMGKDITNINKTENILLS